MHQGSLLSPLLFILVMEKATRECRVGGLWELLYSDDLALTAETQEEVELMFGEWRLAVERRGLKVNLDKTKMMVTGGEVGMLWGWGGIHVGCVAVVLGLPQFCVQHVGNGVIRGVRVWDA